MATKHGRLGTNKDVEKLARQLRKQGWRIEVSQGTHLRWTAPSGRWFSSSLTGSIHSLNHIRSDIRRITRTG